MKRLLIPVLSLGLIGVIISPVNAQDKKERDVKKERVILRDGQEKKEKMEEYDEIIIRQKKSGGDAKVIVEIRDGEVIVNGEPLEKFENDDVAVLKKKARVMALEGPNASFRRTSPFRSEGGVQHYKFDRNENKAMLGVATETKNGSVIINEVTENSAAAKSGLQKGDVITKIDDIKIESSQELIEAIGKFKPEEKVTVTYKRNGKENKATATLGKRSTSFYSPDADVRVYPDMEYFDFNFDMDQMPGMEGMQRFKGVMDGRPRLGIRAQETEDGKGLKVLDVADESIASKAGIKEDDIILEFNGKSVNSTEELLAASKETKDKNSFNVKINRDGKTETIEVKIPKKLKTANL